MYQYLSDDELEQEIEILSLYPEMADELDRATIELESRQSLVGEYWTQSGRYE